MIIIEGPDNAGKTTLAHKLAAAFAKDYQYMNVQHLTRLPDCHDRCFDYISLISRNAIFDRFHLSETVYHSARNDMDQCPLTNEKIRHVNAQLILAGCVQIVMCPSDELILSRWGSKEEMYDEDLVLRAAELYRHHAKKLRDQYLIDRVYHFDNDIDFDVVIEEVIELHDVRKFYLE